MTFRPDWRVPTMWISLSVFNLVLATVRFHKHGWLDGFALIQFLSWSLILVAWAFVLNQSWQFRDDSLVMKRLLLPGVRIPYNSITSIDWTHQRTIALTLGGQTMFRRLEMRTILVRDTAGFLSQLEQHVTSDVLHI